MQKYHENNNETCYEFGLKNIDQQPGSNSYYVHHYENWEFTVVAIISIGWSWKLWE